ncbi:MAG TPA: Crp/Fnr family transcriptional regulator [Burkholderiales bacterium]
MSVPDAVRHADVPALEEWRGACPGASARDLEDREVVYVQGDHVEHVYIVDRGYIVLHRRNGEGHDVAFALLSRGDAFGPGLTGRARAEETASANGPARLLRIPAADLQTILARRADIAWSVLRRLAARERLLLRRLEQLDAPSFRDRVIGGLVDLFDAHGEPCAPRGLSLRITRPQLADLCGTLRPHVSMVLRELRTQGLVRYNHESIYVEDYDALRRLHQRRRASC